MTKLEIQGKACDHGNMGHCKRCEEAKQTKAAPVAKPVPKVPAPLLVEVVDDSPLSDDELVTLAESEEVIEKGIQSFVSVGNALEAIRASRLYRVEYPSFDLYCRGRWAMGKSRANQLIVAATMANIVGQIEAPDNASQATAFSPIIDQPEMVQEVWDEVRAEGKPTTAAVKAAVNARLPDAIETGAEKLEKPPALLTVKLRRDDVEALLGCAASPEQLARVKQALG